MGSRWAIERLLCRASRAIEVGFHLSVFGVLDAAEDGVLPLTLSLRVGLALGSGM